MRADGTTESVQATRSDGRWHAPVTLYEGDRANVAAGGATDEYGERNAADSVEVVGVIPQPAEEVRASALEITDTLVPASTRTRST